MNYQDQINHPKWQRKRLEVMEAKGFQCQKCGNADEQLHVHHPYYLKGALIWEYPTVDLQCLCHTCHSEEHGKSKPTAPAKPYTGPSAMEMLHSRDYHEDLTAEELIQRADVFFSEMARLYKEAEEDGESVV